MSQTNKPTTENPAGQSITSPEPTPSERRQPEPREGSTMWAAIEVLRGKRKPMSAAEIYAEIRERNLAPGLKGKTPDVVSGQRANAALRSGWWLLRAKIGILIAVARGHDPRWWLLLRRVGLRSGDLACRAHVAGAFPEGG